MRNISLLGANFDSGNMGVGALTMGAIECVNQAWPNAEISFLDYDDASKTIACKLNGGIIPIKLIAMRFSKKFYLGNNIALLILVSALLRLPFPKWIKDRLVRRNNCLRHLEGADMVLSIAGGDSFSDIYGQARFYYIVLPLLWAIAMKKKIVIMPQTIGPFANIVASRIAAFILRHSQVVYARDKESLALAQALLGPKFPTKARFSYDLGFLLAPIRPDFKFIEFPEKTKRQRPVVGLNISGLLCMGGYSRKNMFALKVNYSDLIRALIQYLVMEKNVDVLLIPHVFGESQESDVTASVRFFQESENRYGSHLRLAQGDFDQNEIKFVIGQCDFFIGSRMHACIAALSQGIPGIAVAYSRKFHGVLESIGMENLIADPRQNSLEEILAQVGMALDLRIEHGRKLQEKMRFIKHAVLHLFQEPGERKDMELSEPSQLNRSMEFNPG